MDKISFVSPSSFVSWESCHLKAVLERSAKNNLFFHRADADLGTLIHSFYEKAKEWRINREDQFEIKWQELIAKQNQEYQLSDTMLTNYPLQWQSKYYAIKKQLLKHNILIAANKVKRSNCGKSVLYEQKIKSKYICGRIDMLEKDNDIVKSIVDFKTGNVYEKVNGSLKIKEAYKKQLALYCAAVLENQEELPKLFIENLSGDRIQVYIDKQYVDNLKVKAQELIRTINDAIKNNNLSSLANCNVNVCSDCSYRPLCDNYKSNFLNSLRNHLLDIKCTVKSFEGQELYVLINGEETTIRKVTDMSIFHIGKTYEIYNLYCNIDLVHGAYMTTNTIVITN